MPKSMNLLRVGAAMVSLLAIPLVAQDKPPCRWGLVGNTDCAALEKQAAERITTAKTSCLSSESGVTWSKSLQNPNSQTSLGYIRSAYLYAYSASYRPLPACRNADLIFKFNVDKGSEVALDVIEAESGESVFREQRSIADEDADLHRLAVHFFRARMAAKVIGETYRTAHRDGCTDEEVFKVLSSYSDEDLANKHFSCRGGSESSPTTEAGR